MGHPKGGGFAPALRMPAAGLTGPSGGPLARRRWSGKESNQEEPSFGSLVRFIRLYSHRPPRLSSAVAMKMAAAPHRFFVPRASPPRVLVRMEGMRARVQITIQVLSFILVRPTQ